MASSYVIALEGLDAALDVTQLAETIPVAERQAINKTVDRARAAAAREIRKQVNFPAAYLTDAEGRLRVSKRASSGDMEAVITARQRPTSLARFTRTTDIAKARRDKGVRVEVAPGHAVFMKGAFLIRLRAGNSLTDTQHNLGVAIRLKAGETLRNKHRTVQIAHNVFILYGPSIDQVFRTVREDVAPDAREFLAAEFLRLINLRK